MLKIHDQHPCCEGQWMCDFNAQSMQPAVLEHFAANRCVGTMAHQKIAPITNSAFQSVTAQIGGSQHERCEIESA